MKRILTGKIMILCAITLLLSCHVMLIGAYDEVTDQGFQKVQNGISGLLVRINNNLKDPAEINYAKYKPVYEDIEGQIQSVKIRCNALPKYAQVITQANSLDSSFQSLEQYHKLGLGVSDTSALRVMKRTFDIEFKAIIQLQNGLKREKNIK